MGIDSAVLHFGKYRGQSLSDVPLNYLFWLREQDRLRAYRLGLGHTGLDERDVRRMVKGNGLLSIPFCVALNHHIRLRTPLRHSS